MADVSRVEAGYRLSLNHPEPVFEYSEDNGPPGPSPFILVARREIVMRRIASESAKSWSLRYPTSMANSRRVSKKREWGLVVFVFGLGMKEYMSGYGDEYDELTEARENICWHPILWCATHPFQCYGDAFIEVFFEGPNAEFHHDEFISMDSEDSAMEPNLPPETHFAVEYRE